MKTWQTLIASIKIDWSALPKLTHVELSTVHFEQLQVVIWLEKSQLSEFSCDGILSQVPSEWTDQLGLDWVEKNSWYFFPMIIIFCPANSIK